MKPQTFGLDTSHVPLAKLTYNTTALFFLTEVVEISVKEPRIKVDAEEPNPTRLLKALFMCGEAIWSCRQVRGEHLCDFGGSLL